MTQTEMLEFLELADRFRATPIVDDDFTLMRDRFDFALRDRLAALRRNPLPRTVCLCGSTRFKAAWYEQTKRLTHEGFIVLGVGDLDPNHPTTNCPIDPELKARLDELHLRKIDQADEVLVLNVPLEGTPYVGESTRREIAYAESLGKPVRYLHPPGEQQPCPPPSSD